MPTAGRDGPRRVEPVAGALGATVTGIDLAEVSEAAELDELRRALADHLVVFLPEQDLDLDDLERVTDLLGGRDVTPFVDPLEDRPYVIRVIKEPDDALNFANAWHSDLSYLPRPAGLHAPARLGRPRPRGRHRVVEPVPRLREPLARAADDARRPRRRALGRAWPTGPGGLLDEVKDLTSMAIAPSAEAYAEHVHPAVTVHPVTGRRALYVNPVYTTRFAGWTKDESAGAPGPPVPAQHQRELHLPVALVRAHARHLGQPLHHAQRVERLLRRATRDVPHQRQGHAAPSGRPRPAET